MLQSIPEFCPDQLILVDLVSSIRVIPIDTLVQTVRSVVRQPPNIGQNVSWHQSAALAAAVGRGRFCHHSEAVQRCSLLLCLFVSVRLLHYDGPMIVG